MKAQSSRREFLRLSAGMAIALGLAPGCARFRDSGRGDSGFSFVVMNDAHFHTASCPDFFRRVSDKLKAHSPRPDFLLFAGDLTEKGTTTEVGDAKQIFDSFSLPWHAVPGNHDYISNTDRSAWDTLLPKSLNFRFEHRGWQFVGLDSTEGTKAEKTKIQPPTLAWVKENAPKLKRKQPTIIFSHFPLGPGAPKRPLNTDELLETFTDINLVAVFGGHHHAYTEQHSADTTFVTNRCCSISKPNHDKTIEKGYFLCTVKDGAVQREFIEVARETLPQQPKKPASSKPRAV